jgi:hypothetical protein
LEKKENIPMSDQNLAPPILSNIDRDAALADLADFEAKLSFLIGLSVDWRSPQKMGNTGRVCVEEIVPIATQNAKLMPASYDRAAIQRDMELYRQLAPIADALQHIYQKVNNTMLVLESDLYAASLEAHACIKQAGETQGLLDAFGEQLRTSR